MVVEKDGCNQSPSCIETDKAMNEGYGNQAKGPWLGVTW